MITTVTTTTTTAVTSIAAASFALIVILTLIALLVKKEIIGGLEGARAQRLSKALNAAIIPLLFVFVATVALKVFEVLS
jgi:hypothetical protein